MHNGCMATLTLKNVPDELYQRLKEQAARHRRSLNQEAIAQLQAGASQRSPDEARQAFARGAAFREELREKGVWFTPEEIDAFIEEGRR